MKGYFSFVIVVFGAILFGILIVILYNMHPDLSGSVSAEDVYAKSIDAKHIAIDIADYSTKLAIGKYITDVIETEGMDALNVDDLKESIRDFVYANENLLFSGQDYVVWCGRPSSYQIALAREESEREKRPVVPTGAFHISNEKCKSYIYADIDVSGENISASTYFDYLGFSICGSDVCDVSYVNSGVHADVSVGVGT